MTRVVKIEKTGGPEVLKFETIEIGDPGPEEVLIEHKAIGLNFIDTYHRSGLYPIELPSVIGAEGAGIIKEIGSKVKGFSVGDNVAYAGAPLGSYSTERNYPIKNLVKVPREINLDIIATLMIKGLTTFYLLHKTFPVSAGETVLFHAAAGGVGQIFCQWAKSLDCKIIGTVGSDEKINIAKKKGCDFVINYSKKSFSKKDDALHFFDSKNPSELLFHTDPHTIAIHTRHTLRNAPHLLPYIIHMFYADKIKKLHQQFSKIGKPITY